MKVKHILGSLLCGIILFGGTSQAQVHRDWGCMSCPVAKTDSVHSTRHRVIDSTMTLVNRSETPRGWYDENGNQLNVLSLPWDTVIDANTQMVEIVASTVVAAEHFNGYYNVQEIPYCPPHKFDLSDMDHHSMLPYTADDVFDANNVPVDFPFQFFGIEKSTATVGPNGVVTFDTRVGRGTGMGCPYSIGANYALPWVPGGAGYANTAGMIDAIYCIFEDLDPAYINSWTTQHPTWVTIGGDDPLDAGTTRGTYKGYQDSITAYPCRHICFSWNGVPTYSCGTSDTSFYTSKQLVIYEGTNIIEFHVKKRKVCTNWQNGYGIIGIENATGLPQESHHPESGYPDGTPDDPLFWITPGAPPSFAVDQNTPGNTVGDTWNIGNTTIVERAWRFTPQGTTNVNFVWKKVTDSIDIPISCTQSEYNNDPNRYPVAAYLGRRHTDDTKLFDTVSLFVKEPGIYKLSYYFEVPIGSTTLLYGLHGELDAYVTVGIDTIHNVHITITGDNGQPVTDTTEFAISNRNIGYTLQIPDTVPGVDPGKVRILNNCQGHEAELVARIERNPVKYVERWKCYRYNAATNQVDTNNPVPVVWPGDPAPTNDSYFLADTTRIDDSEENPIFEAKLTFKPNVMHMTDDELFMCQVEVKFENGMNGTATIGLHARANYYDTTYAGICDGQSYTFEGNSYTHTDTTGNIFTKLSSFYNCDSIRALKLQVFDIQHTYFDTTVCDSLLWNNRVFYATNTATSAFDTMMMKNQWGCDSVEQLRLVVKPLLPRIVASPSKADLDHMTIQLIDASLNNDRRQWTTSDGQSSFSKVFYYSYPQSEDSVTIKLHSISDMGCTADTTAIIPLIKESLWVPNAFTPKEAFNKTFKPQGVGITKFECYIYNRSGELVYTFKEFGDEWDGRNMSGKDCPQGTYVYLIRYSNNIDPNSEQVKKGTVLLLR